jgi:hypothetical protein
MSVHKDPVPYIAHVLLFEILFITLKDELTLIQHIWAICHYSNYEKNHILYNSYKNHNALDVRDVSRINTDGELT